MKDGKLTKWLFENRCFIYKDDKRSFTHLCLDGGKLCIPQELHNEFMKKYTQGLEEKEKYYICEVPTKICRMYCDLDFIDDDIYDLNKIKEVVKILYDTVYYYYDRSFNIIVCMTTSKNVTRDKKQMVKTGVHLIWENLYVNKKTALNLSKQFVEKLREKFGERPDYNKWSDVIDECVYSEKSASLRMVGSSKISKKKRTNEDGKTELVLVDEGRIYKPVWMYSGDYEGVFVDSIQKCNIRVFEAETEWIDDIPEYIPPEKPKKSVYNGTNVVNADPLFYKVEDFIRNKTLPEWDRPLKMLKNQGKFYIAKIDSGMYCLNIKRDHNSCGIYFQIFEEGLVQRCFCRCKTKEGRQNGFCSDFKSKYFRLPFELKAIMFPMSKKKKVVKKDALSNYSGTTSVFGSYSTLKKNRSEYLKMSMNTIYHLEQTIKNLENGDYYN